MASDDDGISRRRALQILGGAGAAGLAGCSSLPGGGEEHGERVPTITLSFFTGFGGHSDNFEQWADIYRDNLESLGISAEISPQQINAIVGSIEGDERVIEMPQWVNTPNISRLEPGVLMNFWSRSVGQGYGSDGFMNFGQWVNCDYEEAFAAQATASDEDQRRELIHDAISTMSNDAIQIPEMPVINYGAWLSDEVDLQGTGGFGISPVNPYVYIRSSHTGDGRVTSNVSPDMLSTPNPESPEGGNTKLLWGTLVYSPLAAYNEQGEFNPVLAESYEFENDGRRFVFTLREGLTFHDGEPITTEDVEFTLNLHLDNPQWTGAILNPDNFDSFEAIDDRQFAINWNNPNVPILSSQLWKVDILPQHVWEAATDNVLEFVPDPIVGSGPFQVQNYQTDSLLHLVPFEGHPLEPQSEVVLQTYQDQNSAIQAFKSGEINVVSNLSFSGFQNIQDTMSSDEVGMDETVTFGPYYYLVQCHISPTKFFEFRDAIGTVMDRELMNQTAFGGSNEVELNAGVFMASHPFRPPDDMLHQFTDDPAGDEDAAREKLSAAGWTWDDDGNLHYPSDADLSPLWEQGQFPEPDTFPCIDADGNLTV